MIDVQSAILDPVGEWVCRVDYGGGYHRGVTLVILSDGTWTSQGDGGVIGPVFGLGRWSLSRNGVLSLNGHERRFWDPELSSIIALRLHPEAGNFVSDDGMSAECRRLS